MSRRSQGKKKHSRNHSGWNYFQNSSAVSNRAVKNNANQKLLSISMLVSGREETTEKSIDSLERLRSRVSSELILVDTGCSEEMHERLAQKADKIVRFAWCDDFSAARMAGLKEASGQWFMFVDDDEWFEDTTELEDFFLKGAYLRYESASYIQRNYLDMEGDTWRDMHVTRMTRMRPQTRFFYPIHESLWPLLEPEKFFDAYVHHFGYASPDPEVQAAKRRRNLGLLLPTIERDPQCMKHYLQAVAEYYAMQDYKSAGEMADKGIANCDPQRVENAVHLDALHAAAVKMRLEQWRMEDAVELGQKYLKAPINELAKAAITGDMIFAYGELLNYDECLNFAERYLEWKDYFDKNRDKLYRQDTLILDVTFDPGRYKKAVGWTFAAALAVGDAERAEKLLAGKPLDLWLNSVQDWYTAIAQPHRERWKQDFSALMEHLEKAGPAKERRMDCWDEREGKYPHLWQLFEILTMPEVPAETAQAGRPWGGASEAAYMAAPGKASGQPAEASACAGDGGAPAENVRGRDDMRHYGKSGNGEGCTEADSGQGMQQAHAAQEIPVEQEMADLVAQLKEKVRLLMKQGQYQAAHGVILQLRGFFPQDPELMELQMLCESRM